MKLVKKNDIKGWVSGAFIGAAIVLSGALSTAAVTAAETNGPALTKRLFEAVTANNLASVRSSITAGANITAVNQDGLTAAGLAIEKGYFNIAHYILGVRNQRSSGDEDTINAKLPPPSQNPAINIPARPTPQIAPPPQQSAPTPEQPAHAVKQWPANKPNPFAPNTQTGSMPIVGTLQKPTVQPVLPKNSMSPDIKVQTPDVAPLKTSNAPAQREIQAPTPITPLNKDIVKKDVSGEKSEGVIDRMVKGVTGAFKSEDEPTKSSQPLVSPIPPGEPNATPDSQDKSSEDGVMDRMWNRITNIF